MVKSASDTPDQSFLKPAFVLKEQSVVGGTQKTKNLPDILLRGQTKIKKTVRQSVVPDAGKTQVSGDQTEVMRYENVGQEISEESSRYRREKPRLSRNRWRYQRRCQIEDVGRRSVPDTERSGHGRLLEP